MSGRGIAVAVVLLVAAVGLGAVPFESTVAPPSVDRSCGSVLMPEDTWGDCIDRRHDVAIAVGALLVGAAAIAVIALVGRRRERPSHAAAASTTARAVLAAVGIAGFVLAAVVLSASSGEAGSGGGCGAAVTHIAEPPNDATGNVDGSCVRGHQRRWLAASGCLSVGVGALVAASTRGGRRPRWLVAVGGAVISGGVTLGAVTVLGWLWLARRGGA